MRFAGYRRVPFVVVGVGLLLLGSAPPRSVTPSDAVCAWTDPPEYYKIDLVPTRRVPAARRAVGVGHVTFAASPFGIALSPEGHYVYDLSITIDNLKPPPEGVYVAWISTPNLDQIKRLGALDDAMAIRGTVTWNKYLVIITLEPSDDASSKRWQGPVVLRGMSRSGLMHTMAGHGPFQQEPCATFGYY
jgi:hypothetical protein